MVLLTKARVEHGSQGPTTLSTQVRVVVRWHSVLPQC